MSRTAGLRCVLCGVLAHGLLIAAPAVRGQVTIAEPTTPQSDVVDSARQVLQEIMSIPNAGIPRSLLSGAEGIAIVPGLIKGGFVVGVRHGRGIVVARDDGGNWRAPTFISVTGGSVGWQAGVQATDLILVFKTKKSVQGLLSGKFTIGGDASAAAGPVGREAAVATDAALKAEIYSYSRSRGLFAGIALDGSVIQVDNTATAAYYQRGGTGVQTIPPSAARLMEDIVRYATNEQPGAEAAAPAALDADTVRRRLGESSQRLFALLDNNWRRYLALPAEVYGGDRLPIQESLALALARYQTVAGTPQYRDLAARPEFQETRQLIEQLIQAQPLRTGGLQLPPPPQ